MREAVLDGGRIHSREALHDALAGALPVPEWYGRNLDALMDSLTDLGEEFTLRLTGREALEEALGPYARALFRVLRRAEEENPRFHMVVDTGSDTNS